MATECQTCGVALVTDGLYPGQQFRCAHCQTLSRFGKIEKVATDRLAWRSFWLGVSSILLLTITGIPAMYYGVRSLLRMRFVKPKRSDQAAAIAGTALGGCFGIFVGFIVACGVLISLIRFLTSTETSVPAEVVQQCSQYFEFSNPRVIPIRAKSTANAQHIFDFADQEETEDRKLRVRLIYLPHSLQPSDAVMVGLLRSKKINSKSLGKRESTESLAWKMNDKEIDVKKYVYRLDSDDDDSDDDDTSQSSDASDESQSVQTVNYFGYQRVEDGLYGVTVGFETEHCDLTESDVAEIFASIRIVKATASEVVQEIDSAK